VPEAEDRYRLLVQSVIDYAIYMLDTDGRVTSWNAGAERIKGFSKDEILGEHFSRFYTAEDRANDLPGRALRAARDEGRFAGEGWRIRKDGRRFWAQVVIDPIRDDSGELVGYAKITRDMTDQRSAQQALLESERRFRILVEGVTDYAIYMLDPEGRVTDWNKGAERAKGYRPDEIIGQPFSRFYSPEDQAAGLPARALATARDEGRFESEGWRVRKDGTRFWAHVILDAIRDAEGRLLGYAKVTRDITERREAEQRLAETREQLFQSQKFEALGQLTGGMAHDFNNLLTAIISGAELALRQKDPERVRSLLENVRSAAQRGSSLTRQLLAFSRRQPLDPKVLNLQDLLPSTRDLIRHSLPVEIDLGLEVADPVWKLEADPGQLELAILNLGFNARDAMPKGGSIRLTAENVTLEGTPDGLTGEFVAIGVEDTGPGIPPEIIERVIEPFFTTKDFGHGTGLGLSQVYGFARQSGGTLCLNSSVGEGTTATIYLPAAHAERTGEQGDQKARRILVVEDDEVVAELAAQLLEEMGYESVVVHSAQEALAALDRGRLPDIVFSDIVMPGGLSGLELARRVRRRFPEMPVLLTSGYSDRLSDTPGEFPMVPKPYQFDALEEALSQLLA
jgi:PAS domain S-box-containing protein